MTLIDPAMPWLAPETGQGDARAENASTGPQTYRHALGWHFSDLRDFRIRLIVRGAPMTLKNHKQIVALPGRRPILVLGAPARKWLKTATDQLKAQWSALFASPIPMRVQVNAAMLVYMQTRRRADLSNLYQAPEDAMQAAGVLTDDWQIASHDGSRRLHDPTDPRVEIVLTPYRGEVIDPPDTTSTSEQPELEQHEEF